MLGRAYVMRYYRLFSLRRRRLSMKILLRFSPREKRGEEQAHRQRSDNPDEPANWVTRPDDATPRYPSSHKSSLSANIQIVFIQTF